MKNLNNIMNLNRHYVLLLLMVILMIPSQDLSAKKKKQVKEPTESYGRKCCIVWLNRCLVI